MPLNGDEPKETASVAAEVIAEFEANDGGDTSEPVREITDDKTKDEKPADDKKVEEKKPEAKADDKKTDDDDDDFDKVAAEIDDPKVKGKKIENRIPHSRVKRMVERARKAIKDATEAEWKGKYDPLEQNTNAILAEIRRLDTLMASDPDAFISEIAKAHPAYKEFVRQVKAAEKAAEEDPEPQPDVPNEKGEMVGYSIGQAKKLMQWTALQEVKGVRKEIEPVKQTLESAQRSAAQRARQAEQDEADLQSAQAELEDAEANWPGFKENREEIERVFMSDKKLRLHDAYRKVYVAKLQEAAANARAQVLEEMKQEPVLGTGVGGGSATKVVEEPRGTVIDLI